MIILFGHEVKNDFSPKNILKDRDITIFSNIDLDRETLSKKELFFRL